MVWHSNVHTWRLRLRLRQRHCQINIDAQNGFRPILCIFVCVTIAAMLNFHDDVDLMQMKMSNVNKPLAMLYNINRGSQKFSSSKILPPVSVE